ncbi:MAG: signal peptide peptidase SppA, partial [Cyanobacteria bacterium J06641_5]
MRQFLKQTTAGFLGSLAGLIVFFGLAAAGSLGLLSILASSRDEGPQVKQDAVLVFDLATPIRDARPPVDFRQAVAGNAEANPITLRQAIAAIDAAAADKRISGLFLDGSKGNSEVGLASLRELREALERFQASGKEIFAYEVDGSERDYYLLSAADTVALNPLGTLEFNGFSARQAFFAGAIEQYGVGVQVVRAGRYKSAVEPLVRSDLSPDNREQLQALLGDLWNEVKAGIAAKREVTAAQLQNLADTKGLLLAEEAQAAGLADEVTYYDGAIAHLKGMAGKDADADAFPQISLRRYITVREIARAKQGSGKNSGNEIAVVYAEGGIASGNEIQGVGGDRFAKIIRRLRQDEDVKAIVLRVNSPGGSATASEVLLREVQLAGEEKPIVVSMGDIAASGGYWIATGADRIFAAPNTITGSIGVFGVLGNFERLANDNGITWDGVKTAELADLGTLSRPKTEAELARYQVFIDRIYDLFLDKVATARNLSKEQVAELAQGRV